MTTPPGTEPAPRRPRVVMFLYHDVRHDARVLREARTLAEAGWTVTVVAGRAPGEEGPEREELPGLAVLRVPLPVGWRAAWSAVRTPWRTWPADLRRLAAALPRPARWPGAAALVLRRLAALPLAVLAAPLALPALLPRTAPNRDLVDWLLRWRLTTLAWNRRAAAAAPAADVYHAHDLNALLAAATAARRRGARLVYDSHEVFTEAGRTARRPWWAKALLARQERAWARDAAAVVTVNEALADELRRRLGAPRVLAVHNAPARWSPPPGAPDRLRAAAGLAPGTPVALHHGQFFPHRGIEELMAAVLEPGLERVHAVVLGFGPEEARLRAAAAEPRFGGRVHVLPGVPPDELAGWVACADVGVAVIAPSTLNHRLSTPNKLFECLAAGVPVVISDLPGMRGVVLADPAAPLGVVARSPAPADVAAAIRAVLELPAGDAAALRARCLRAAHGRWNWETESERLVALYRELAPGT